jgi:hypothetical protein
MPNGHVWFWTFWHWSREGVADGALLRSPLHGIAGHWDEWFRHEASPADRRAVEAAGRSRAGQRAFAAWLARRWAPEAARGGERPPVRFVLAQLAQVPPFDGWAAFAPYRAGYGRSGVSAIVLTAGSRGEAADVRDLEAVLLPRDRDPAAPSVVAEGFETDPLELDAARRAALSALGGAGLMRLLARWAAWGARPYPAPVRALCLAGWAAVAALLLRLTLGPEPGAALRPACAALLALWAALVLGAVGSVGAQAVSAWRVGRGWQARLAAGEVRLRMRDGLTLQGGSAGLAFCLGAVRAAADVRPRVRATSYVWRRVIGGLSGGARAWAATGVVAAGGRVEPVALGPKLRAALLHGHVRHLLAPAQRGATRRATAAVGEALAAHAPAAQAPAPRAAHGAPAGTAGVRLGFAASPDRLRTHPCGHVAHALMAVGGLASPGQLATNVMATAVSAAVLLALPDLRDLVAPPPAPAVVGPASPSQYALWVGLATTRPAAFSVVLESDFWANRRASVVGAGGGPPPRAELRLTRATRDAQRDVQDGVVWVERRRHLLGREFLPGERVGRYTLAYVSRVGGE